jgi:hypothetical protein
MGWNRRSRRRRRRRLSCIGDLCCTTEKKDAKGENRNRPFIHRKDLPSLESKITHHTAKSKGFLAF